MQPRLPPRRPHRAHSVSRVQIRSQSPARLPAAISVVMINSFSFHAQPSSTTCSRATTATSVTRARRIDYPRTSLLVPRSLACDVRAHGTPPRLEDNGNLDLPDREKLKCSKAQRIVDDAYESPTTVRPPAVLRLNRALSTRRRTLAVQPPVAPSGDGLHLTREGPVERKPDPLHDAATIGGSDICFPLRFVVRSSVAMTRLQANSEGATGTQPSLGRPVI